MDETTFINISNSLRLLEKDFNKQNQKNRELLKTLSDVILSEHEESCTKSLATIEKINNTFSHGKSERKNPVIMQSK